MQPGRFKLKEKYQLGRFEVSGRLVVVAGIVGVVILWVLSGELFDNAPSAAANEEAASDAAENKALTLVRGIRSTAESRTIYLDVRGHTRANREVQVKSEISGKLVAVPGEKGKLVKQGDLLCRIAVDARDDEYNQALADVKSNQLEFDGIVDLNKKGLHSDVLLARAEASLEQSKVRAKQAELALQNTKLLAPFDGVVADQLVEVGDYLTPGGPCVNVMEVDPILIAAQVAEKSIGHMALHDETRVRLITGDEYQGHVSFLGYAPDMNTRTFPIEVTVPNPDASIRTGLTAEMRVPVGTAEVHLISPASLVLNDTGTIGVRIVDDQSRVRFREIEVVGESPSGVQVKGLPGVVNLITLGQEEVIEGQQVEMDYSALKTDDSVITPGQSS